MERRVMSLSRRSFTKEFKEAAVPRLELGASVAEVARACEVNGNVLHRWRRELREFGAKVLLLARLVGVEQQLVSHGNDFALLFEKRVLWQMEHVSGLRWLDLNGLLGAEVASMNS